jgi:hypothetical protein
MKNYLKLFLLLITTITYAQTESSVICKTIDEFTDNVSLNAGGVIIYEDGGDMHSEGMYVSAFLSESTKRKDKGKLSISTFYVKVMGIEGCVDTGSTLVIIFDNGEKTQLVNWNDFDCKGTNYFKLDNKEELFKGNNIKAIKYTNKRNYDSMIIKENIGDFAFYLKNVLLEIDSINERKNTIPICEK